MPGIYVDLVKKYGPLWITTDSASRLGVFSPHARILKKITGTGTPDGVGTEFTFIDPADGLETLLRNEREIEARWQQSLLAKAVLRYKTLESRRNLGGAEPDCRDHARL